MPTDAAPSQELTLFLCGPKKCEHDYSLGKEIDNGWTAVCSKCGASAIDEAMWNEGAKNAD